MGWLTHSGPDEAYGDLEKVMQGLNDRNFNAVRLDTVLNCCFHRDGSPRGEVAVRLTISALNLQLPGDPYLVGVSQLVQ